MPRTLTKQAHDATKKEHGEKETSLIHVAQEEAHEIENLLHIGEPLLAYNSIQKALADHPGDIRLRQLKGLALARSGALRRANDELAALRDEGFTDGETLGLLARTHKDLALDASSAASREAHLAAAYEIYAEGYYESSRRGAIADAYYTGINAATMAFLRDDTKRAREIAAGVEELCQAELRKDNNDGGAYWVQATLAEAALILGNHDVAQGRYVEAAKLAGTRYGDLSSTRHQARLLLEHAGENGEWLDDAMRMPPVLVYSGHMIDAPGRLRQRFPAHMEGSVREEIYDRLQKIDPAAAYGSAACGADILCLECVQELGGELHIVLPFPAEQFRAESVDLLPDGQWGTRFERLLESANEVLVIGERPPAWGTSTYEYANLIMTGLARLRAQMLDTRLQALAVWDGTGISGAGGTGSQVSLWQRSDVPLEHVSLPAGNDAPTVSEGEVREQAPVLEYKIKSMMFADAVGYSKLSEDQIPLFLEHYLGAIGDFNAHTSHKAVHIETAGDGMYAVFDEPGDAASYALGVSELVNSRNWQELGLPEGMNARVGLHCGPVFAGLDPITGRRMFSGVHTNRAARIEPITPPGQVYASSAFAALAAACGVEGLHFSYIGRTQLAKHYGALPLYHVKHR